ncbi:hypothetical protein MBOU_41460 [Mycobacterium bourgelatii]|uniref:Uncharacterized protein n=1 Tax=Mycobacterium bourgelatii TaxID=1273442 RepID=A0A7I9YTU2_MYCBU|nr:hypothetical protein MBOU_41460 [Mycobacterium bourgelatii]
MYVTRVPNRGSPPAVLLRESYRDNGKVKTRTLANLSHWPERKVEKLQRALKGLPATRDLAESFEVSRSLPHGHVAAVLGTAGPWASKISSTRHHRGGATWSPRCW